MAGQPDFATMKAADLDAAPIATRRAWTRWFMAMMGHRVEASEQADTQQDRDRAVREDDWCV